MKRCHLPVLQCTAVQEQKLNSGLTNSISKISGYQVSLPLQIQTSTGLHFISFMPSHTGVDVLFSYLQTAISLLQAYLLSDTLCFSSAPSSPSLFSPCKTLSHCLWRNKVKLPTGFKVLLCRSVARWSVQQNIRSMGKERNAGKSLCSGLLMSYELENTAPSKTSLCSPSNKWEGIWLRR